MHLPCTGELLHKIQTQVILLGITAIVQEITDQTPNLQDIVVSHIAEVPQQQPTVLPIMAVTQEVAAVLHNLQEVVHPIPQDLVVDQTTEDKIKIYYLQNLLIRS